MAEEYYENLHSRKKFYASLVDEINKAFIEHGVYTGRFWTGCYYL